MQRYYDELISGEESTVATLVEPSIDIKELADVPKAAQLQTLMDEVRDEVEVFYSKESVSDAVAELNRKQDDEERSLKVLRAISFDNKPNEDLAEMLKHREEMMRIQAIDNIHQKLLLSYHEGSNEHRELVELLRNNAQALTKSFKTKKLDYLTKSIDMFVKVMYDHPEDFLPSLKQSGGLKYFARLLSYPPIAEDVNFLLKFLVIIGLIVSIDGNRDEFLKLQGVVRLIPFLYHKDPNIIRVVSDALSNLSFSESSRILIVKTGVIPQILENTKLDYKTKVASVLLLTKLSRCEVAKDYFDRKDLSLFLSLLSIEKAYKNDGDPNYKAEIEIQKFLLDVLYNIAVSEKNQYNLYQENIVGILVEFFKPLHDDSYRWNFEIFNLVLLVFTRILEHELIRSLFLSISSTVPDLTKVLTNAASYPEDVVMRSGSILTMLATKGKGNGTAKLASDGLNIMTLLYQKFPTHSHAHNLLAMMVDRVAKGENRAQVFQAGADKILMTFIKDSRVKEVLVHSCSGLACLSDEPEVVRGVVRNKLLTSLLALLKLGQPELTLNITTILAAVAEQSETGRNEIAKKGTAVLVQLLNDDDVLTQEKVLLTFYTLLSAPAVGQENIDTFLRSEGERPLMDCILSNNESVQVTALKIVQLLSNTTEQREILRDSGVEECFAQIYKNVLPQSQSADLLRKIQDLFKLDYGSKDDKGDAHRLRVYWLKIMYHTSIKFVPIRETLTYKEFLQLIKAEFITDDWDRLTVRNGIDEIEISDQRMLNWIIFQLSKDKPIQVDVQHKNPDNSTTSPSKLDTLLQRLTHKQLRLLLKEAIDQEAEVREAIGQYITINRTYRQSAKEERLQREPYGRLPEELEEIPEGARGEGAGGETGGGSSAGASSPTSSTGGVPPPPPPQPGNMPIPPPPPKPIKPAATGDLMTDIKNALRVGGGLRRTSGIGDKERKERGLARKEESSENLVLKGEEAEVGIDTWKKDVRSYVETFKKMLTIDYHMALIIFKIVEKSLISFDAALEMMDNTESVDHDTLATIMIQCGFYVTYSLFKNEDDDDPDSPLIKKHTSIISPYDLPIHIVLKIIQGFIKANGNSRRRDPLRQPVALLREQQRAQAKTQQEADQSFWAGRRDPSGGGASGFDNNVVSGYWKQKEQRQVGKLW